MAIAIKHPFHSAKSDGSDSTFVKPSDWNAAHTISQAAGKLLGLRSPGADGNTEEISITTNFVLAGAIFDLSTAVVFPGTGAITLPTGNSSQRPSSPVAGMLRYNTTLAILEKFEGGVWGPLWALPTNVAVAGTLTVAGNVTFSSTGFVQLPTGTTAQRPGSPTQGMFRFNSDTGNPEVYAAGSWQQIASSPGVSKRQTVLAGPTSSGIPALVPTSSGTLSLATTTISTATPLVLTAAVGFGTRGNVDVVSIIKTNVAWGTGFVGSQTISTITVAAGVATVTTAVAHNLVTGAYITISGATSALYNGTQLITVTGGTTFTFPTAATTNATVVGAYTVTNFLGFVLDGLGGATPLVSILLPQYIIGIAPLTTVGQYTFDKNLMQMVVGNGSSTAAAMALFVGEIEASAASLSSGTTYSYMGYTRQFFSAPILAAAGIFSINHNMGTIDVSGDIRINNFTAELGFTPGMNTTFISNSTTANALVNAPLAFNGRLFATVGRGNGLTYAIHNTTGVPTSTTAANWGYLVEAWRTW